jgi:DNA-binding response OmpR family regulator
MEHNCEVENNIGENMPFRILTIDDDRSITDLLVMLLQTEGFEAIAANTGEEGIKLIKEAAPDVVLLDLMMPEMNGWQFCKEVRQFSNVPILVLSALDAPELVAQALDAGADDYMVKPIACSVMVASINKLARRNGKHHKTHLPVHTAVATP